MFISVNNKNIVKSNNIDILKCVAKDNQTIEFVNGLAVVKVQVTIGNGRERSEYDTVCIVEECRDNEGKVVDYKLANEGSDYFNLDRNISDITRIGDDFIFEILCYSSYTTRTNYKKYIQFHDGRRENQSGKIDFVGGVAGKVIPTTNPDIGIIKLNDINESLYSISQAKKIGNSYSSIEDIDGKTFMVVDTVYSTKDENLRDHLVFIIDEEGKRVTKISSRNDKMKEVPASLDEPYNEICARVAAELDDLASIENEYIQQLRLEQGINK